MKEYAVVGKNSKMDTGSITTAECTIRGLNLIHQATQKVPKECPIKEAREKLC